MTGDSSVMAENPDQSPISRGSQGINASLMPHGVATALAYIGAALASLQADLPFVAGARASRRSSLRSSPTPTALTW